MGYLKWEKFSWEKRGKLNFKILGGEKEGGWEPQFSQKGEPTICHTMQTL